MSAPFWYAVVAGVMFLAGGIVLQRLGWPAAPAKRVAAAAMLALTWPLALPTLSFGFVAVAHLVRTHIPSKKPQRACTPVAAQAA